MWYPYLSFFDGVDWSLLLARTDYVRKSTGEDLFSGLAAAVTDSYQRKRSTADRTAIAGLSMGGGQALQFGLNHPDQFGWMLSYSAGAPEKLEGIQEYFANIPKSPERRLLWIACGKDDFLLKRNEQFCEWLTDRGVQFDWKKTDGAHSWPVWRGYLQETLPLLFQLR